MISGQIPFKPTHHPLLEKKKTLSTGTNEPEITYEKSEISVHPQYTDTINLEGSKYQS